ncbi:MAG: hypothetical protein V2B19_16580 [Pseudomonadota bacterium]
MSQLVLHLRLDEKNLGVVLVFSTGEEDSHLPLDTAMRRHIEAVLQSTEGRIQGKGGAAVILGIPCQRASQPDGQAWHSFLAKDNAVVSEIDSYPRVIPRFTALRVPI